MLYGDQAFSGFIIAYCLCPLPLDDLSWGSSGHLVETTMEELTHGRMGGRQPGLIARQVLRYNYTPY